MSPLPGLPLDFKINNYATATAVTPSPSNSNTYIADLKRDWCVGLGKSRQGRFSSFPGGPTDHGFNCYTVPSGGYLASIIARAAQLHIQLRQPKLDQPDLITCHIEFIARAVVGYGEVTVTELSLGRQYSTLRLQLYQYPRQDRSRKPALCCEALLRQGNLKKERASGGLSLPTRPILRREELPKRDECVERMDPPHLLRRRPAFLQMKFSMAKDTDELGKSAKLGPSVKQFWVSWQTNNDGFTIPALCFVADAFRPIPESYGIVDDWFPTLSYGVEVKKEPPTGGWKTLFVRIEAHEIKNGRYDMDLAILDEDGDLVALSKHAVLMVPAERNHRHKSEKL